MKKSIRVLFLNISFLTLFFLILGYVNAECGCFYLTNNCGLSEQPLCALTSGPPCPPNYGPCERCNCVPTEDCNRAAGQWALYPGQGGCESDEVCCDSPTLPQCTPDCTDKQCGDNGCGGSCGTCSPGRVCYNNQCCTPSCPSSTNVNCGTTYTGSNNCGGSCNVVGSKCDGNRVCYNNQCCTPSCPDPSTVECGQSLGSNGCGGTCPGTGTFCGYAGTCSNNECSYEPAVLTATVTPLCLNNSDKSRTVLLNITCKYCGTGLNVSNNWNSEVIWNGSLGYEVNIYNLIQIPEDKILDSIRNNQPLKIFVESNRSLIQDSKDEVNYDLKEEVEIPIKYQNFFYCPKHNDVIDQDFDFYDYSVSSNYYKFYSNDLIYNWEECNSNTSQSVCVARKTDCIDKNGNYYPVNTLRDADGDGEIEVCVSKDEIQGGWLDLDVNQGNCSLLKLATLPNYGNYYAKWFNCTTDYECLKGKDTFKPISGTDISGLCCGDDSEEMPMINLKFKDNTYKSSVTFSDLVTNNINSCCLDGTHKCVDDNGICRPKDYYYIVGNEKFVCKEVAYTDATFQGKSNTIGVWLKESCLDCEDVCDRCNVNKEGASANVVDQYDLSAIVNKYDSTNPSDIDIYDINKDGVINQGDYDSCRNCVSTVIETCNDGTLQSNEQCDAFNNNIRFSQSLCPQFVCESINVPNSKKVSERAGCDNCQCLYNIPKCVKNKCGASCGNNTDCPSGYTCNLNNCSCELIQCPPQTTVCPDGTCKQNCAQPPECGNPNICELGNGCECPECNNQQDNCAVGAVCSNGLCGCPPNTKKCPDGTCKQNCTQPPECGDPNVCELEDGCDCPECNNQQDGCVDGAVCSNGLCGCPFGTTYCNGVCLPPDECLFDCIGNPNRVCDRGEGCTCSDCLGLEDSCAGDMICGGDEACGCPPETTYCNGVCLPPDECLFDCIGNPNRVCDRGEGCTCSDCLGLKDTCAGNMICGSDEACGCPEGTTYCKGQCLPPEQCPFDCIGNPNRVCDRGEGCTCSDCNNKQDSCVYGLVCDYIFEKCVPICVPSENPEVTLNDGIDNDCDGLIDELDFSESGLYIWEVECNYYICTFTNDSVEHTVNVIVSSSSELTLKDLELESTDSSQLSVDKKKVTFVSKNMNDIDCVVLETDSIMNFDVSFDNVKNKSKVYLTENLVNPTSVPFSYFEPKCSASCTDPNQCAKSTMLSLFVEGCSAEKCLFSCGGYWINVSTILDSWFSDKNFGDYCLACQSNMSCKNYTNEISCVFDPCDASLTELDCEWNGTTCIDNFLPCMPGTTLCKDGTCSDDCEETDGGVQGCINDNGKCDFGEGCACEDCEDKQDSCRLGAICSNGLCGCPVGTTLCKDGTCSDDCEETDGGVQGCINNNGKCDLGEGCGCFDCDSKQDSCVYGSVCSFYTKACISIIGETCDKGEALCNDNTCDVTCENHGGKKACIGQPNKVCSYGEGCACEDCFDKRDSCKQGLLCNAETKLCEEQRVTPTNDSCVDNDKDGFFKKDPNCYKGNDCNDNDASINPNAIEICNNIDDDCNGIVDDDCMIENYALSVKLSPTKLRILSKTKVKLTISNNFNEDLSDLLITLNTPSKIEVIPKELNVNELKQKQKKDFNLDIIVKDYMSDKADINLIAEAKGQKLLSEKLSFDIIIPKFGIFSMLDKVSEKGNMLCYDFYYILDKSDSQQYDIELDITDLSSIFGRSVIVDYISNAETGKKLVPMLSNPYCLTKGKIYTLNGYLYKGGTFKFIDIDDEFSEEIEVS